jgi:hypothetical protein
MVVQSVDLRDDVLLSARSFQLVDNLPELKNPFDPVTNPDPLELDGVDITVTVDDNVTDPLGVWVYIEGGAQPIVQKVEIPTPSNTANEPLALPPGSYRALMLAPGYRMHIAEITVT